MRRRIFAMTHKRSAGFVGALVLVGLSLLPMLVSGFYGDDEANSLMTAKLLEMKGQSLATLIATDIVGWVTSVGRFFPLAEYYRVVFWTINGSLLTYKTMLMLMVMVNAALLHALTRRLTNSTELATVAVLSFAITIQFRYYHEPVLSYAALLPLITALVLASLYQFLHYLESGRRLLLFMSVTFFGTSLLVYEVALPMCLIFVVLAARYPRERTLVQALKASWIFLATAGFAVANVVLLKLAFHLQPSSAEQLSGYQPNFSFLPITITVVKQVVASFPLTYYASRMSAYFLGLTNRPLYDMPLAYLQTQPYTTLLCAAVFFSVGLGVIRTYFAQTNHSLPVERIRSLALVGLAFLILPNTLIALAPRHQTGVEWGEGYLPVYMSAVGVALLMTAAFHWLCASPLSRHRKFYAAVPIAMIYALMGALNFDNNRITVESLNRARSYPARVTEMALSAGLLNPVPPGSWIVSNISTAWQVPDFYRLQTGKSLAGVVAIADENSLLALPLEKVSKPTKFTTYSVSPEAPPVFYIHLNTGTRDAGYAMLIRVNSFVVAPQGVSVAGSPLIGYRTWPTPSQYDWQQIKGWPLSSSSYQNTDVFGLPMTSGQVLASGSKWSLDAAPDGWILTVPNLSLKKRSLSLRTPEPEWSQAR